MTNQTLDISQWRQQLTAVVDYDFRKAYTTGKLSARDRDAQADVIDLTAWWNKCLTLPGKGGRNKIRILDLQRYRYIRDSLQVFSADQIASAIYRYSQREWNRSTGNWKKPDNFFKVSFIRELVEEQLAASENTQRAQVKRDKRVVELERQIAAKTREKEAVNALKTQFNGLDVDIRRELLERAANELISLGRVRHNITAFACEQQALVILRRENEVSR